MQGIYFTDDHKQRCRSSYRCTLIACGPCSRRYARRLTHRLQARFGDRLCAVEIEAGLSGPAEFERWRIAMRNLVDHARRDGLRWWREFGLVGWLTPDGGGRIHGVIALGSLTPEEVIEKVGRRWPTRLRRIEVADLRREIEAAVRPGVIATTAGRGGYQSIKLAIYPRRLPNRRASTISVPSARNPREIDPLPVLIG